MSLISRAMKTGSAPMIQSQSQSRPRGQHHHHHHEMRTSWAGAAAAAAHSTCALYLSCPRPGNELIRREAASKKENLLQLNPGAAATSAAKHPNTSRADARSREQTEVIFDRFDLKVGLAHFREFIPPICSTAASQKLHEVNHHLLFFPVLISHFF